MCWNKRLRVKSVLTTSSRRGSNFAGWDARRNTAAIAVLLRGFATPQIARKAAVPQGWSEIGRFLRAGPCLHPGASGGASLRTHPDCTPTRLRRDRQHVLMPPGPPARCWLRLAVLRPLRQTAKGWRWRAETGFRSSADPASGWPGRRPVARPWDSFPG